MSELAYCVGGTAFLDQTTRHSRSQYQKLLRQLLGQRTYIQGKSTTVFNTLSAGAAMIGLAARANGANILVDCRTASGPVIIPSSQDSNRETSEFTIVLWLIEPTQSIADELSLAGEKYSHRLGDPKEETITLHGGALEISRAVAQQSGCDLAPEIVLELWQRGVSAGECASWEVNPNSELLFRLSDSALNCQVYPEIAPLADKLYGKRDRRQKLSRKAASILLEVLNYTRYDRMNMDQFNCALQQIFVSYSVGCLKSMISNSSEKLSQYSWTITFSKNPACLDNQFPWSLGILLILPPRWSTLEYQPRTFSGWQRVYGGARLQSIIITQQCMRGS